MSHSIQRSHSAALAKYPELRRLFCQAVARHGSFAAGATAIRLPTQTIQMYMQNDPEFARQVEMAKDEHRAKIEQAIYRRAIEGVDEPRFSGTGQVVGTVTKYSDTLLLAYAKRHIPEYREGDVSRTEISVNGTLEHEHRVQAKELTGEQRAALRTLLAAPEGVIPVDAEVEFSERDEESA